MIKISWCWPDKPIEFDIYSSEKFYNLFSNLHNAEAKCLKIIQNNGSIIWLPLLLRKLKNYTFEAFSSYGYGGFQKLTAPISDIEISNIIEFLKNEGICAVFIRHSPWTFNHKYIPEDLIELNRITYQVKLDLLENFDDRLRQIPQKLRWSVNFAKKSGINISIKSINEKDLLKFYDIYTSRMKELNADKFYLFNKKFFINHLKYLPNNCDIALLKDYDKKVIGGALFLRDDNGYVHYYLSACKNSAMKMQAMEYLIVNSIHFYSQKGFRNLFLGGGIAKDENDGLSRFKKKFGGIKLPFYISKIIVNSEEYEELRKQYKIKNSNYFLIGDAL